MSWRTSSTLGFLLFIVYLFSSSSTAESPGCVARDLGNGNIICVCNSTYCDRVAPVTPLPRGQYWRYTSSIDGQRLDRRSGAFMAMSSVHHFGNDVDVLMVTLNRSEMRQTILGFGGAFTDAAAINVASLSSGAQEKLIDSYFSTDGIEYTLGRVPIGGCDFSTRLYTYDDDHPDDFNLTYFQLADEDLDFKIPLISRALASTARPLRLFASPWSAPGWMKSNGKLTGQGSLKGVPGGPYYQAWANYFVKFLQEYAARNVTFWAVTAQNEPTDGQVLDFSFNCMGFTAITQRIFIGQNLGPTLERNGFGDVSIFMLDDQRLMLPGWAKEVMEDEDARHYVTGIAFHWYINFLAPPVLLDRTHDLFPDLMLLASEACEGSQPWELPVVVGSWDRGEHYAIDIIQDLQHWTQGWVDWNLALNTSGGPNWTGAGDDSPILVNASSDEFYKQPMYYTLGHFSKFVLPGSVVVGLTQTNEKTGILSVAFSNPDNSTVLVILNQSPDTINYSFVDLDLGTVTLLLERRSIQTLVWWPLKNK